MPFELIPYMDELLPPVWSQRLGAKESGLIELQPLDVRWGKPSEPLVGKHMLFVSKLSGPPRPIVDWLIRLSEGVPTIDFAVNQGGDGV